MHVHLVQPDIRWEDKQASHDHIRTLLEAAPIEPGGLIVLPEMFDTGFSINLDHTADDDGRSADFLRDLARDTACTVIGGIAVNGPDGMGRNRALFVPPGGGEPRHYDKVHPFSHGREGERFAGGNSIIVETVTGTAGQSFVICPVICYDLRFPELFRVGLDLGAEVFIVIANWPQPRQEHWRALLRARAIENLAYVVAVNRVGADPHLRYAGGSAVIDPRGEVLLELGPEPTVESSELCRSRLDRWRDAFPALRDRQLVVGWPGGEIHD